jgi:hypothetical protein
VNEQRSGDGTFAKCRQTPTMSVDGGRPEVNDRVSQKEGDHAASGGAGFDSWRSSADDAHAPFNAPHLIVTASTKPTSVRLIATEFAYPFTATQSATGPERTRGFAFWRVGCRLHKDQVVKEHTLGRDK